MGEPLLGQTLGGSYTVVRVVGEGGMGTVYEARHTRVTTRRFAIKMLHPEHLRDAEARARFKREAEAAAAISSPHVAGVYDVGRTEDGTPYLVSELLEGEDLNARLERVGRIPVQEMVRIARQVCRGLAAAHARGVVHRDIKPGNVFLTGDPAHPTARILDFGISRVDAEGTQLTRTGMIVGTPAYMAPEQARGHQVDARTDIYSLGALLYRGLCGCLPFDRMDPAAVLAAVLLEEPRPVREIVPEIPASLELTIQRAMAKDPDARFQNVRALDEALAPFDEPDPRATASKTVNAPGQGNVGLARPLLVAYAVLGGLSILVAFWMLAGVAVAYWRGGDPGATLTPTESAITGLIIGLVALTPTVLFWSHVRRHAWGSTMKALELLQRLRSPVLAGFATYGLTWLVVRSVEGVVLRHPLGAAWPVWDAVMLGGAAIAALYARRKDGPAVPRPVTVGVAALILFLGAGFAGALRGDGSMAIATEEDGQQSATSRRRGNTSDEAEPEAPRPPPAPTRASAEELQNARVAGVAALEALAAKFPEDTAVLEALAVAQAAQPNGRKTALATIARVLDLDPDAWKNNASLERILREAVEVPAVQAEAFALLADKMGTRGADVLYELMTTRPDHKARAAEKLAVPAVLKRATPALRIAYELSVAKDCEATKLLLPRAENDGDERASKVLAPLIATSTRRCGFLGLSKCSTKGRCATQSAEIQKAINAIRARTAPAK